MERNLIMTWTKIASNTMLFTLCATLIGCSSGEVVSNHPSSNGTVVEMTQTSSQVLMPISELFSSRDTEIGYTESESVSIHLDESSITVSDESVAVEGNQIKIQQAGTYIISGTLTDGQIVVDVAHTEKVHLVLRDLNLSSSSSAPIYVPQADKVVITLEGQNELSTTGDYVAIDDSNIDAVIFSKADLTLNGEGELTIDNAYGHGIVTKDDLRITGGTFNVIASSHGIVGKNSVGIMNATFNIESGKDGIHSEHETITEGNVYLVNGTYDIQSQGDGISASGILEIQDGEFNVVTGGGSEAAPVKISTNLQKLQGTQSQTVTTSTSEETVSTKGLKSGRDLYIHQGTLVIDSYDDGIHSNANITIIGGSFEISSGDDGIHADTSVVIEDGEITVLDSYEGIEGNNITINGGNILVEASDDGINAGGGVDASGMRQFSHATVPSSEETTVEAESPTEEATTVTESTETFTETVETYIVINGGMITVHATGDGLDSNGTLEINGGDVIVKTSIGSVDAVIDYDGTAVINGGNLITVGSSSMAQSFSTSSLQGSIMYNLSANQEASTPITLTDASGNVLMTYTPDQTFQSIMLSTKGMTQGETYTLTVGEITETITLEEITYSNGGTNTGGKGSGGMRTDKVLDGTATDRFNKQQDATTSATTSTEEEATVTE